MRVVYSHYALDEAEQDNNNTIFCEIQSIVGRILKFSIEYHPHLMMMIMTVVIRSDNYIGLLYGMSRPELAHVKFMHLELSENEFAEFLRDAYHLDAPEALRAAISGEGVFMGKTVKRR